MPDLVDVYPYRLLGDSIEVLVMKRASDILYSHQWRMIGGKVNEGETAWQAARRELKEETNHKPLTFWVIPSMNHFYDFENDYIYHIPAFAAELSPDKPIELNHEHIDYQWIEPAKLDSLLKWPEQIRLFRLMADLITDNKILENWIIDK